MTIASYSDLKTRLAELLGRNDLSTQIDIAIDLVESELSTKLQSLKSNASATATATAGTRTVTVPSGIEIVRGVQISASPFYLSQVAYQAGLDKYGQNSGQPLSFSYDADGTVSLFPLPDTAYTITFTGTADFTPLSGSAETNWIITNYPLLYLAGAMRHLCTYTEDVQRKAEFEAIYQQALTNIFMAEANRKLVAGQAKIMTQGSTP